MKDLVKQQIEYYQARAGEYDEWFLRQGRYDRGEEQNQLWFAEVNEVRQALAGFAPRGQILELACGTGLWTEQLLPFAESITAVDASAEVIQINQGRLQSAKVNYVQADLFNWLPDQLYDVIFFSFWLSHVPPEKFDSFWQMVAAALKVDGRLFFIDSLHTHVSTAKDHILPGEEATVVTRRLNDGREFDIVKIFYKPGELTARLKNLGWQMRVRQTQHFFLYGAGQKSDA